MRTRTKMMTISILGVVAVTSFWVQPTRVSATARPPSTTSSIASHPSYRLDEDPAGRGRLIAGGPIGREGTEERYEVGVPPVRENRVVGISPFGEFGNVANGLPEEASGMVTPPPVPDNSGVGRRVVYSNSKERVWLVDEDRSVIDTYLVSGKLGVPAPGEYEVYSKSELAFAGHDGITMSHMVRFAQGAALPIGFHAIPLDANGHPLQSEEELGEYHSAGCVRQSPEHAAELFDWAVVGTPVVVLA